MSRRDRSLANILNKDPKDPQPTAKKTKRTREKVQCNCDTCKGKLVDPRTKKRHDQKISSQNSTMDTSQEIHNESIDINELSSSSQITVEVSMQDIEQSVDMQDIDEQSVDMQDIERYVDIEEVQNITDDNLYDDIDFEFLPRERISRYTTKLSANFDVNDFERSESESEKSTDNDSDGSVNNGPYEIFEDYACPPFNLLQDANATGSNQNNQFSWILLWIMNFRKRFNIPETATEALIKFMKLVLTEIGGEDFSTFPESLYKVRNNLGLKDQFRDFVPCPKCHKLYERDEVENFRQDETPTIMKCRHVEFPNSSRRRLRLCQEPLSRQIRSLNGIIFRPELIYPFAGINNQLATMFRRPGFESSLRHWANRTTFDNILTDIYDGEVWKTFKDNDSTSTVFFRPDVADSHLGLMLNLDWFQPYDGTTHSTGAIYAAICNLPRDIRFKRENLLLLGLLPGPNEVSLHKINHYLAPIVNELESLWNGVTLNTNECPYGKRIRAALILVSCDIPAARKICGHVSALVSCHRCEKKANKVEGKHNFAGMDNMDEWFIAKNPNQHRQDAIGWRRCNSNASRERFVKECGVRWSELLRLSYFDPIRFMTVDPMHCLFLGIAKWIIKRIWIDQGILTTNILEEVQSKMNQFSIPADIGRIPGKIYCGEGFSNFTADQWKIFFTIYATVLLWEHLESEDRKILTYFVRVCQLFVSRIIEVDAMREAHQKLIEIVKLIESNHGRDKITPNLHLSLHLAECSFDYGPLYTFWCFSFERMNGVLGMSNL
jgi:hypothetical protein